MQARDLGYDYIHRDKDPLPTGPFDGHGTAVAGIIGMSKDNGVCGVGVAYGSTITGVLWDTYWPVLCIPCVSLSGWHFHWVVKFKSEHENTREHVFCCSFLV